MVDDVEVGFGIEQPLASRCVTIEGHRLAVVELLEDRVTPHPLKGGQWRQDQHLLNHAGVHQEVGCPQRAEGLACADGVEHQAPLVERDELSSRTLVVEGCHPAGPVVLVVDRGWGVEPQFLQALRLQYLVWYNYYVRVGG